ncbi:hypothetical protein KEM48_006502 [Puccinia striiformis f. sp. tritici PST-130]|nr:hypothetical protein KEM48_006502 [Puccinia striiformis f. sp. tritici PST-130]
MAWMSSRPSRWLPDGLDELQAVGMALEHLQAIGRPSRRPGAHPGHREAIPTAWSSSRPSGSHPDGLELIQAIGKPSRRPGAHPGHREAIPTAWSSSRPSGSHPDGLELIQAIGKPSRRPGAHPGHQEAIPTAWSSSRPSGSHLDGLEFIQAIGKPSRRPGAHPGHQEAIPTARRGHSIAHHTVQSPWQRQMMLQHGQGISMVDATHNAVHNHFLSEQKKASLYTIMIRDRIVGKGLPVAWAFTASAAE